jgi:hypothetical protein
LSANGRYRHTRTLSESTRRYEPSLFDGAFVGDNHRRIKELVADVPGKLQSTDQHKLYEMAYFASGPVVEVGRAQGKSLSILALAVRDAGSGVPIYSIELNERGAAVAERNLEALGVRDLVTLVHGDSALELGALGSRFDLVFLDGDHSYVGVRRDLEALEGRVERGGSMMLHDYFDYRNHEADNLDYGVVAAADELAPALGLAFRGGYGSIALFEQT